MIRFFDLDGTLTEPKQKISSRMKQTLVGLHEPIYIISAAVKDQILWQVDGLPCTVLAQSGNDTPLWRERLTTSEIEEVKEHIASFTNNLQDSPLCTEYRGSQVSFSFIGHKNDLKIKAKFDPKRKIRQTVLKQHPFKSKTLVCRIGGTTCLDYNRKSGTKGKNIIRWIRALKLNKKDCIFYGDALFKNGNDESVKGVIPCVSVKNPKDLLKKLC